GEGETGSDGKEKDGEKKNGKGKNKKSDPDSDKDGEGEGAGGGEEGEEEEEGEKKGSKNKGDKGDEDKGDGKDGEEEEGEESGEENNGSGKKGSVDESEEAGGHGAGGYSYKEQADGDIDWSEIADAAVGQAKAGEDLGLKDGNEAFGEAIGDVTKKEDKDLKRGEAPWRPYDPGLDEAALVQPSRKGKEDDAKRAEDIIKSVRQEIAYLRARLRTVLRAMEMTAIDHGVPKGKSLSSRYLVDTRAAVRSRELPRRAYDQPGIQLDMSFATVMIVDESGSMCSVQKDVTRIFVTLTEPFDGLGCATMAMGFRNGNGRFNSKDPDEKDDDGKTKYHRTDGVHYDIFKNWNERFSAIRWRFANTIANGSTPMADGIQYALNAISKRDEANRVIFVVTDGCPDGGHEPIIRRQIRLAREAGIYIVGVGLGSSSKPVLRLFDDSVYADKIEELPKLLIEKLNKIVDAGGVKRGRRVQKS
ncbi:MAG: vWA domain-containing protein, partial [Bacteroidota bacterium]